MPLGGFMSTNFRPVLVPLNYPETLEGADILEMNGLRLFKANTWEGVATFDAPSVGVIPGFERVDVWAKRVGRGMYVTVPLEALKAYSDFCEKLGYRLVMIGYSYPPVWCGDAEAFIKEAKACGVLPRYGESFS